VKLQKSRLPLVAGAIDVSKLENSANAGQKPGQP